MSFRRILISVDESPLAAHAADVGIDLAHSLGAEVAFVYVVDPVENTMPEGGVPGSELIAMSTRAAKSLLASFSARAAFQLPPLEFVPVGKPAAEVVKAAREWPAEIIVLGSHGRGGVGRLLLGSVAEGVMRHAPCPVLVVRAES